MQRADSVVLVLKPKNQVDPESVDGLALEALKRIRDTEGGTEVCALLC